MCWPPERALVEDVNLILIGYEGRKDMWRFCFGVTKPTPPTALTPEAFDANFSPEGRTIRVKSMKAPDG